ncbi:hypothetical protein [Yeosuana sp. AK3]
MKKIFLILSLFLLNSVYPINTAISTQTFVEDCEDVAFNFVDMYYDNGGTDNIEAGYVYYAALYVCETKKRQ